RPRRVRHRGHRRARRGPGGGPPVARGGYGGLRGARRKGGGGGLERDQHRGGGGPGRPGEGVGGQAHPVQRRGPRRERRPPPQSAHAGGSRAVLRTGPDRRGRALHPRPAPARARARKPRRRRGGGGQGPLREAVHAGGGRGGRAVRRLSYDEYERLSGGGGLVPVFREIPGDLLTPVSAFLALRGRSERAFLLESVAGGENVARYSFVGRDPVATVEARLGDAGFLSALRSRLGPPAAEVPGLPRFTGGAVGYLAYDAVRLFERIPQRHGPSDAPVASFSFYRSIVAFDHVLQRLVLIADAEPGRRAAFEEAQTVLDGLESDLRRTRPTGPPARAAAPERIDLQAALGDGAGYRDAVARAQAYIAAGDVFQVVLSRKRAVRCPHDPFTVYRALRMVNPSPYMFFLKDGETAIAGASPEMLVRMEGRRAEMRPIAGTRPRGATA